MSYFGTVANAPGLNRLPDSPFELLDLGYLVLADGENYQSTTGGREILAVLLGGKGTFVVNGQEFANVGSRPNVFSGKPHSVYIPCQANFTI
jgi:5-deoxy-glucuronate isomerase